MTDIPLKASVTCTDGPCGTSRNFIINPATLAITHVVVEDKSLPDNETRIVPVAHVAAVAGDQITLDCTVDEVAKMKPFVTAELIQESASGQAYSSGAAYTYPYAFNDTSYDTVDEQQVPLGEIEVHPGMEVQASDGKVGKMDELILDPKTGNITHIQMREGHLWGKKDVAIPVSDVDFVDEKTIYLTTAKADVKNLPAVSVKRSNG
jgi:sporulation protein YlmC with PRC-barrel domain